LAFREWRGILIVFDPSKDRTGPSYDGYLTLPKGLVDLLDNDGVERRLVMWAIEKGVNIHDSDGFEKIPNSRIIRFSGMIESRKHVAKLFKSVEADTIGK
jgi:hypothetical protein